MVGSTDFFEDLLSELVSIDHIKNNLYYYTRKHLIVVPELSPFVIYIKSFELLPISLSRFILSRSTILILVLISMIMSTIEGIVGFQRDSEN